MATFFRHPERFDALEECLVRLLLFTLFYVIVTNAVRSPLSIIGGTRPT